MEKPETKAAENPPDAIHAIDAHVHLYPEAVAAKAVPALAARFGNPPAFDGTAAGCAAKDAACGIALSVNLPVATRPESVRHMNDFWAAFAPSAPSRPFAQVASLACLHPDMDDPAAEIERVASLGFTGIKFHPEYQKFRFNETRMDRVWSAMAGCGLAAYLHAGGERVFEPPYRSSPAEVAKLHKRFPGLKIVAAHLGGFGMWDETEEALAGEDVYLDLSHTLGWMPEDQIMRIIEKHGARRVLFGSDAPWQDPGRTLTAFLALPLDGAAKAAICSGNARRLLRLP